ncbi:MAG: SAM-dependent DNA methyltransferase, partial [Muribaculaceae bacterium]|nr:SAM-dependent DNA methyltransferase [Muribaculaceae bacterium]
MTESKKNLLALLNTTLGNVAALPEKIAEENMYLDDGFHVDTEFLMEILSYLSRWSDTGMRVMKALQKLLGIEEDTPAKDKKSKEGKKWSVEDVLRHCTFKDNILYLPNVQLNPKSYADVKTWITEAGGKWTGGKVQGFTFDFDATRVASILMSGKRYNLKQEFQFFATPSALADWLVSLSDVNVDHAVLEPSAGTGAIIDAIHQV